MRTTSKMRIARGISKVAVVRGGPERTVERRGITWELDLREAIDFSIFFSGYFQKWSVLEVCNCLPEDGIFLDIGANRGAISFHVARKLPKTRIYSIEPVQEMIAKMNRTLDLNPEFRKTVHLVNAFFTSAEKIRENQIPSDVDASWNLFGDVSYNELTGATSMKMDRSIATTLDEFVVQAKINRLDVIKVDVDGYEVDVLEGARNTLERHHPLVVLEWAPYAQTQRTNDPLALVDFLSEMQYAPQIIRRFGKPKRISWHDLLQTPLLHSKDILLKYQD
jgi:FkbM family methyltransferase